MDGPRKPKSHIIQLDYRKNIDKRTTPLSEVRAARSRAGAEGSQERLPRPSTKLQEILRRGGPVAKRLENVRGTAHDDTASATTARLMFDLARQLPSAIDESQPS